MPTYHVTSPDGHTYEVTAPAGATQDQVMSYVQQQHAQTPQVRAFAAGATEGGQDNALTAGLRGIANAGLFGAGDYAAAGARYLGQRAIGVDHPDDFSTDLSYAHGVSSGSATAHPNAKVVGEVAGSLTPGGAAAHLAERGLAKVAPKAAAALVPKAGQGLRNVLRYVGSGALGGGAYGAAAGAVQNADQGPAAAAQGALTGGTEGAAAGGVAGPVAAGAVKVGVSAAKQLAPASKRAIAVLADKIDMDPAALQQAMADHYAATGRGARIADVLAAKDKANLAPAIADHQSSSAAMMDAADANRAALPGQASSRVQQQGATQTPFGVMSNARVGDLKVAQDDEMNAAMGDRSQPTALGNQPVQLGKDELALLNSPLVRDAVRGDTTLRSKLMGANDEYDAAQEAANTRGKGNFYHGTSTPIQNAHDYYGSNLNYYGSGLYTTDAMDVAKGYARKGGGGTPTIYNVREATPAKLFNMEAPLNGDGKQLLSTAAKHDSLIEMALEENPKNMREMFDAMRGVSQQEMIPASEVQESFDHIGGLLEERGYAGMQHTGGLRTKTDPHTVRIYFKPSSDVTLHQVTPPPPPSANLTVDDFERLRQALRGQQAARLSVNSPRYSPQAAGDYGEMADQLGKLASAQHPGYGQALDSYGRQQDFIEGFNHGQAGKSIYDVPQMGDIRTLRTSEGRAGLEVGARSRLINTLAENEAGAVSGVKNLRQGSPSKTLESLPAVERGKLQRMGAAEERSQRNFDELSPSGLISNDQKQAQAVKTAAEGAVALGGHALTGFKAHALFRVLTAQKVREDTANEIVRQLTQARSPADVATLTNTLNRARIGAQTRRLILKQVSRYTGAGAAGGTNSLLNQ